MNKFLNDNWFKLGLLATFIIIGLSIAYYFFFPLPMQLKGQENYRLQVECRNLGEKIDKEVNPPDNPNFQTPYVPEFYYNQKLGKCFYYGGYDDKTTMFQVIIDVGTNKEIASVRQYIKGEMEGEGNIIEFDRKKKELFSEK